MNKCEFCEYSKNENGVFVCGSKSNNGCFSAILIMNRYINKTVPFEKCKYCKYAIYEGVSFNCNMLFDSKYCEDAIELLKKLEGNND